jgi:hypothetical protein
VNLKTAKALGFPVSPSILLRADEVIQLATMANGLRVCRLQLGTWPHDRSRSMLLKKASDEIGVARSLSV